METEFTHSFLERWQRYFGPAELPIGFYYTDQVREEDRQQTQVTDRCLIGNLNRVRQGAPFVYSAHTPGCEGGKRYTGFAQKLRPNFAYFLSCGIPGKLEGERYKQSPQLVEAYLQGNLPFTAPGPYLVFKRFDRFAEDETPQVIIFFAPPDVLAGLFALANYDRADPYGVITPMGSGCASIISYPLAEANRDKPQCVLGMFDVSARPCTPVHTLTFALPFNRFTQLVHFMDESFLITPSWEIIQKRLA